MCRLVGESFGDNVSKYLASSTYFHTHLTVSGFSNAILDNAAHECTKLAYDYFCHLLAASAPVALLLAHFSRFLIQYISIEMTLTNILLTYVSILYRADPFT